MSQLSSPRDQFGIRMMIFARRWQRSIYRLLAEAGLTHTTWMPLLHLEEQGNGLTQKELAALVGVDTSSLVRVLDILEADGLILRRRDTQDGRVRHIHMTKAGRARTAEIRRELRLIEDALLEGVADEDIRRTLDVFATIDRRITEVSATTAEEPSPK